jgi:hypothetical protein
MTVENAVQVVSEVAGSPVPSRKVLGYLHLASNLYDIIKILPLLSRIPMPMLY